MIAKAEAESLVENYLASFFPPSKHGPLVVWREHTEDHPHCWVCYWVYKIYLDIMGRQYRAGGNYPIIVDKVDGSLYGTGFRPIEEYVARFDTDKAQLKRLVRN